MSSKWQSHLKENGASSLWAAPTAVPSRKEAISGEIAQKLPRMSPVFEWKSKGLQALRRLPEILLRPCVAERLLKRDDAPAVPLARRL